MPAFFGTTDELKQPMELLAHGVPLGSCRGKSSMFHTHDGPAFAGKSQQRVTVETLNVTGLSCLDDYCSFRSNSFSSD